MYIKTEKERKRTDSFGTERLAYLGRSIFKQPTLQRSNTQNNVSHNNSVLQRSQRIQSERKIPIHSKSVKRNIPFHEPDWKKMRSKTDSLDKIINVFKNKSRINDQINNHKKIKSQNDSGKSRSENKLQNFHKKVMDHRRVRSSSKISAQLIDQKSLFHKENIGNPALLKQQSNEYDYSPTEKQQKIQNLLKLKLKTEIDLQSSGCLKENDTKSISRISKISGFSFGSNCLKPKGADILSKQQLNNSVQLIKQTQEFRLQQKLRANPKQWQFHNCLQLHNIQLYKTNLKISCQGWCLIDHLELKFLRAYKPKIEDDFAPMIRLFIYKIAKNLPKITNSEINIHKIMVRVNDKHIYEDQREKQKEKAEKLRGIAPQSILSLYDLIMSTLISKHSDLVIYSIIALGYILKLVEQNTDINKDPLEKITKSQPLVFVQTTCQIDLLGMCRMFILECERICEQLEMTSTKININFDCLHKDFHRYSDGHKQWYLTSTPLEMCILFMKCLSHQQFKNILSMKAFSTTVKFQVRWNFWQKRNYVWKNQQFSKYNIKGVGGRNNKSNQCFLIWDQENQLIISMADCKVNMHWKDYERIVQWVKKTIPRFLKLYEIKKRFYPTDTERIKKIS